MWVEAVMSTSCGTSMGWVVDVGAGGAGWACAMAEAHVRTPRSRPARVRVG